MAILILMLLVVVWIVVLAPGMWRRRTEQRAGDSISTFHRQLGVLQRAGRALVPPAHRLRAATSMQGVQVQRTEPRSRPTLSVVRPDGSVPPGREARFAAAASAGARSFASGRGDRYFHPSACKRRRDVLIWLVATVLGAGVLGAVPPLHPLLAVSLVAGVALVAYVGLLLRLRTVAVERQHSARLRDRQAETYWTSAATAGTASEHREHSVSRAAAR